MGFGKAYLAIAASLLVLADIAWGQQEVKQPPVISITSVGEARVKPDRACLQFTVAGQATTITEAQKSHDELLAAVKTKLIEKLGQSGQINIAAFDIRSVQTTYANRSDVPATVGYRVTSIVEAVVDLTKTPRNDLVGIIDTAVQAGATLTTSGDIRYRDSYGHYGPSYAAFELADPGAARLAALRDAVAKAGPQAREVAKSLGGKLGKVRTVFVGDSRVFSSQPKNPGDSTDNTVWADIVVQSTVTLNYELEF